MGNNNKIIPYKENIFTKISKFFRNLFVGKKQTLLGDSNEKKSLSFDNKENFIKKVQIIEDSEEKRLKILKTQYDKEEIDEEDIDDEDIDKLIEMYEKETKELNEDTARRKNHIAKMLLFCLIRPFILILP